MKYLTFLAQHNVLLTVLYFVLFQPSAPTISQIIYVFFAFNLYFLVGLTIFHRYFGHRAFLAKNRFVSFALAVAGILFSGQMGHLWWAQNHRLHHETSDEPLDPHDPKKGKLYSFIIWTFFEWKTDYNKMHPEFLFLEHRLLNLFHSIPKILLTYVLSFHFSYSDIFYLIWLPTLICQLGTLKFNIAFHKDGEPIDKNLSFSDPGVIFPFLYGENLHKIHHEKPTQSKRHSCDLSYYLFIFPMKKLKLIY